MTLRGYAETVGLLLLAVASSWGVSRWRETRAAPRDDRAVPATRSLRDLARTVATLEAHPAYRGVVSPDALRSARLAASGTVLLDLDPRATVRASADGRAHPNLAGLLPTEAQGRVELVSPSTVAEAWRLACPDGCALDLLDRDPPEGSPSGGWSVRSQDCDALAWFAIDARRLADPMLGGAGLAPLRDRVQAVERLLGRSIREEIGEGLAGTGVVTLEDRDGGRGPRILVAFDLARSDRIRELVDLVVALAVVAGRGEMRHHRDVAVGVVDGAGRRAALAVDGALLLVSSEPAAITAAIDRRRAGASAPRPPSSFERFRGSWRAESTSSFVTQGWGAIFRAPARPPGPVSATLTREGIWWWLRGEGVSPAVTADPVLPYFRTWIAGR